MDIAVIYIHNGVNRSTSNSIEILISPSSMQYIHLLLSTMYKRQIKWVPMQIEISSSCFKRKLFTSPDASLNFLFFDRGR